MIKATRHSERAHTPQARSIRELVFGVNDGLVSVTGIVMGVTASRLAAHDIVISGLSAVTAATISMGLGAYLSTAAQNEYFMAERKREEYEVDTVPDEERREVEAIYRGQGFTSEETQKLTDRLTADKDRWIAFMMREELGILLDALDSPWRNAWVMAAAVILGAMPPMVPYLIWTDTHPAMVLAIVLAFSAAFTLGVVKARVAKGRWLRSGLQFVAVAAAAVIVGIAAGHLFRQILR